MALLAALFVVQAAVAQVPQGRSVKGFQVAEQNPATSRQSLLTGKDAVAITRERFLIKGLRLEVREQGKLTMLIEAPECLYDYGSRSAWSTNTIRVKSGDDRLALGGEGFEWRETNAVLLISNRVEAVIRRDLVQGSKDAVTLTKPAAAPVGGTSPQTLQVNSRQFTYEANDHRVQFTGDTKVADPSLDLSCERLTVDLPAKEGSVERIAAEGQVVITGKDDGLKAQADTATYVQSDDSLELSGRAAWSLGLRSGRGPVIRLARKARQLSAPKGSFLRLPAASDMGGFLASPEVSKTPGPTASGEASFIEIQSDTLDLDEARAVFVGQVEARRIANQQVTGSLAARRLTAFMGASNRLERIEAIEQVRIRDGKRQAAGESATYTADGLTVLTGDPSWDFGQLRGRADRIQFDTRTGTLGAAPHVEVILPMNAAGEPGLFTLGSSLRSTNTAGNARSIRVRSDRLDYSGSEVAFSGDVRAEEFVGNKVAGTLTAPLLTVLLDPEKNTLKRIVARDKVVVSEAVVDGARSPSRLSCERITALFEGDRATLSTVTAEGEVVLNQEGTAIDAAKALFVAGDDRVTLSGHPNVRTAQGVLRGADVVIWDRAARKYRATGPWRLEWTPPPKSERGKPAAP